MGIVSGGSIPTWTRTQPDQATGCGNCQGPSHQIDPSRYDDGPCASRGCSSVDGILDSRGVISNAIAHSPIGRVPDIDRPKALQGAVTGQGSGQVSVEDCSPTPRVTTDNR